MNLQRAAHDPWVWGQVVLLLAVFAGIPLLQHRLAPEMPVARWLVPAPLFLRLGGAVPLAAGVALLVWGFRSLGPNLTPATEPLAGGTFVETGAYQMVRHPIYLGLVLLLWAAGWCYTGPGPGLVVGVISYLYFDRKAAVEERLMSARFPAYLAYRERVPKLLPFRR